MNESALRNLNNDIRLLKDINDELLEGINLRVTFDVIRNIWDIYIFDSKSGVEIHRSALEINKETKEMIGNTIVLLKEGVAYE